MKKILFLLFVLISIKGFSQGGWIKINNSYGTISNRASFDSIMDFPTGCGSPVRLQGYDLGKMALYGDSCSNTLYFYSPKTKTWFPIGSGGGSGSKVDSLTINDSILCAWQGGVSVCTDLRADSVIVGFGLGVTGIRGHQTLFALQPDGYTGIVTHDSGFVFTVVNPSITLNQHTWVFPNTSLTIDSADLTYGRYDIFGIDSLGPFIKKGVPALVPTQPQVGIDSFALTSGFLINPGDTVPSTISSITVYDETGILPEFTASTTGTITKNITNTDNPYHLIHDIFVSKYSNNSRFNFLSASLITIDDGQVITGVIYLNHPITSIGVRFFTGATASTNNIAISNNWGISNTLLNVYQRFAIPLTAFTKSSSTFNTIRFTYSGYDTSGAGGNYIDDIQFQSGVNNIPSTKVYPDSTTVVKTVIGSDTANVLVDHIKGISYPRKDTIWTHSGGGGVNLPYNGDSTYYLGGDTLLHQLITPVTDFQWSVLDSVNSVISPRQGDIYLVSTAPTGAFTGHANEIATYDTASGFSFQTATVGDLLYNAATQQVSKWTGTSWLRVTVNNYVHILYKETILGEKSFADTLNLLNKPIQIITTGNVPVSLLVTKAAGVTYPWMQINGTSSGSKIIMGANNPGSAAYEMRIIADYSDSIWTGTYRPLFVDAYEQINIRANRGDVLDSAVKFQSGSNYIAIMHNSGLFTLPKYTSSSFYKNDTSAYKPIVTDGSGNLYKSSWFGNGGSGVGNTIYTADDSLISDRIVQLHGHLIDLFDSASGIGIGIHPLDIINGNKGTVYLQGNIDFNSLNSGAITDSVLTDSAGYVRHRDAASFGTVQSVTGNPGDLVDNTDPINPIVNAPTLQEVLNKGNLAFTNARISLFDPTNSYVTVGDNTGGTFAGIEYDSTGGKHGQLVLINQAGGNQVRIRVGGSVPTRLPILYTPSIADGNYFIPLSVNGHYSDSTGNIIDTTGGGGGSGTVDSVKTGDGLSGGPITSTGTIIVDSATLSLKYVKLNDSTLASRITANTTAISGRIKSDYFPMINGSFVVGTSISAGYLTPVSSSFVGRTERYTASKFNNLSLGSSGIRYAYASLSKSTVFSYSSPFLIAAPEFNNYRQSTLSTQSIIDEACKAGSRALVALHFLNTINFIYGGTSGTINSAVTFSTPTGWAKSATDAVMIDYGSRAYWYRLNDPTQLGVGMAIKTSTTTNETLTYTGIAGASIVIGTWATDGSTNNWSRIQYAVDGVVKGTYTPNGKAYLGFTDGGTTDGIMNDAIVIPGLTDTLHTLVLTFLDGSVKTAIDYIGSLITPSASYSTPVYRMDIFHMSNRAGIGYNTTGAITTQAITDTTSAHVLTDLTTTFPGYRIIQVKSNQYYDPTNVAAQVVADGVHPTVLGHQKIELAIVDSMSSIPVVGISTPILNTILGTSIIGGYIQKATSAATIGNSLIYDNGASIGLGTTTINANTLLNLTAASNPMLSLNNSTTNSGYLLVTSSNLSFGENRNPVSGVFTNTGAAASLLVLNASTGNGAIDFYTSNTNNTSPTLKYKFDVSGMSFGTGITPTAALDIVGGGKFTSKIVYTTNPTMAPADSLVLPDKKYVDFSGTKIHYAHNIFTPTVGQTVALINNQYNIINPAGTLASLTVNLPSTPTNNDVVYIKYTQAITLVTYGNGTVSDALTTPSIGSLVTLVYDSGTTTWY